MEKFGGSIDNVSSTVEKIGKNPETLKKACFDVVKSLGFSAENMKPLKSKIDSLSDTDILSKLQDDLKLVGYVLQKNNVMSDMEKKKALQELFAGMDQSKDGFDEVFGADTTDDVVPTADQAKTEAKAVAKEETKQTIETPEKKQAPKSIFKSLLFWMILLWIIISLFLFWKTLG